MKKTIKLIIFILVVLAGLGFFYFFGRGPEHEVTVYFFKGDALTSTKREIASRNSLPRTALTELLKGPTWSEKKKGYFTQIPQGTKARGLKIKGQVAYADFNKNLENYGGGTSRVRGLVAQIVYTLTEIQPIKKVRLLIEGEEKAYLGSEGYMIDRPLGREEVAL